MALFRANYGRVHLWTDHPVHISPKSIRLVDWRVFDPQGNDLHLGAMCRWPWPWWEGQISWHWGVLVTLEGEAMTLGEMTLTLWRGQWSWVEGVSDHEVCELGRGGVVSRRWCCTTAHVALSISHYWSVIHVNVKLLFMRLNVQIVF